LKNNQIFTLSSPDRPTCYILKDGEVPTGGVTYMGIIDSNRFVQAINQAIKIRTEKEIGEEILEEAREYNKTIIEGNYQTLLEYFKGGEINISNYAFFICHLDCNSSKALFNKILDFFKIYNVDRDKELNILIDHAKEKLTRV
jgi:hypothetical protein